jgi:hypothetical protein
MVQIQNRQRTECGTEALMHANRRSTDISGEDFRTVRRRNVEIQPNSGDNMPASYYVIGAVGLLAIIVAIKLTPDLIRYMKMRAM